MQPIIGIVVPIYNVENYLRRCLDSLIHQTYPYLQIVLVNDGSTDGSLEIAKEYLQNDPRFILIDKPNGGLSSARNTGIEFFKKHFSFKPCDEIKNCFKIIGDNPRKIQSLFSLSPPPTLEEISYLFFVDSDDLIHLDCLETYLKNAEENSLEIVASGIEYRSEEDEFLGSNFGSFEGVRKNQILRGEEILGESFCAAWNILINFDFFKKTQLSFIDGILFEDRAFGTLLFLQAKRIMVLDHYFYIYSSCRPGSIMRPKNITKERRILNAESWFKIIEVIQSFPFGREILDKHVRSYLRSLYACALETQDRKKYEAMLQHFGYSPFKLFMMQYFPKTSRAIQRIKHWRLKEFIRRFFPRVFLRMREVKRFFFSKSSKKR